MGGDFPGRHPRVDLDKAEHHAFGALQGQHDGNVRHTVDGRSTGEEPDDHHGEGSSQPAKAASYRQRACNAADVTAEMLAFGNISSALELSVGDGLNYLWWDSLQSGAADATGKEFFIGVNPAAYIKSESSR